MLIIASLIFLCIMIYLLIEIDSLFIKLSISLVLLCASIACIVAFIILLPNTHEEVQTKTIPIVSFNYRGYTEEKTEEGWNGYSSYTYIVTDEKEDYVYYYATNDGGYKQGSIPSKNTVIYEEDNCEKPSIIVYTTYRKHNYISNPFLADFLLWPPHGKIGTKYEIHVPKGTIISN